MMLLLNLQCRKNDHLEPVETNHNYPREELLVSTRLFDFDSSYLQPWIEGITHLRAFGVDFLKPKDADGLYQYVDEDKVNAFISFCKRRNLKVVWTLNLSSFTLDKEIAFVKNLITKGLNIVAFEYGGEFYLQKYYYGKLSEKGVVEQIRMDGTNRDYLNLLDIWIPAITKDFPYNQYEHILVTASASKENSQTMNYRREFNKKVFEYVKNNPQLSGKFSFSYHLYAGVTPAGYNQSEEVVIGPDDVDWSFLNEKPVSGRWVVTESGYYIKDYSESQLDEANKFYLKESEALGKNDLFGIHTLVSPSKQFNPLAFYNATGITPVGQMIKNWVDKP